MQYVWRRHKTDMKANSKTWGLDNEDNDTIKLPAMIIMWYFKPDKEKICISGSTGYIYPWTHIK